jgi:hypothetical protein
MTKRPIAFAAPGRFEFYAHSFPSALYAEGKHDGVQICVAFPQARYTVTRRSETGRLLVHNLGARDILAIPAGQPQARRAGIASLMLSDAFITQALGVETLCVFDTFTVRDPFISAAARQA